MPLAYGTVNTDGTTLCAGANNWTCTYNTSEVYYTITVTAQTLSPNNTVPSVSLLSCNYTAPYPIVTPFININSGLLNISFLDKNDIAYQGKFSFVIYKQ